jgi:RNA polymerase sigma-70 factor (ECF subfamily)
VRLDGDTESEILAGASSAESADREAAFTRLHEAIRGPVLGLGLHLTGNRADAEDVFQEVLLAVYLGLPRFRGESRLTTWVYRIAIRAALRQRAKAHRRRAAPLLTEPAAPAVADPAQTKEESEKLARALSRLPIPHRTVLALFAIEGCSHEEIAETLGVPVGTVWSRLHNARKRLAAEMRAPAES